MAPPPSRSLSGGPVRLLRVPLESGKEEMGRESKIGINWHPLQRGDSSRLLYTPPPEFQLDFDRC